MPDGKKGAGLLLSDQFVLTSADLLNKEKNSFKVKMINGKETTANAVRVNPNKNVALLLLDEKIDDVRPLPLSTGLPEVNKDIYMTLGVSDLEGDVEGYLDSNGKSPVIVIRRNAVRKFWSAPRFRTLRSAAALVDKKGNIVGIAIPARRPKTDRICSFRLRQLWKLLT